MMSTGSRSLSSIRHTLNNVPAPAKWERHNKMNKSRIYASSIFYSWSNTFNYLPAHRFEGDMACKALQSGVESLPKH